MRKVALFGAMVGALAMAALSASAFAQATSWPDKTVKVIVPYAAGGATDAIARPWCDELGKAFGQQFVVENRGGASGMIGVEAAIKAPPDGYTLIMTPAAPLTILPSLRAVPYDPVKSLAPIGRTGDVVNGFVIHPSVGVKTFAEFLDYAKKNPGEAHLCLIGQRHRDPSQDRGAEAQGGSRHPARALSRRRRQPQ